MTGAGNTRMQRAVIGRDGLPARGEPMRRAEQVVAALCVVLGVGIVWEARRMEHMTSIRMEKHWSEMEEQIKPLMSIAKEK